MSHGYRKRRRGASQMLENTSNKIIAENFPNTKKDRLILLRQTFRTPNRQDHKTTSPCHIAVKTLDMQSKGKY
jgi:hypothetical protein